MVLNPEVMKKAQEELDRVVGKDRLPDFPDKENLPYIDALLKELLRWNAPLPLNFPSRIALDDEYKGYYIPAGATVMQNVWAVFRDPNIYPEPEAFNPSKKFGRQGRSTAVLGSGVNLASMLGNAGRISMGVILT